MSFCLAFTPWTRCLCKTAALWQVGMCARCPDQGVVIRGYIKLWAGRSLQGAMSVTGMSHLCRLLLHDQVGTAHLEHLRCSLIAVCLGECTCNCKALQEHDILTTIPGGPWEGKVGRPLCIPRCLPRGRGMASPSSIQISAMRSEGITM